MASKAVMVLAGLLGALPVMALADSANFDIPAQPLAAALRAFAEQAHMQLLYQASVVRRATGTAVSGELDKRAALEQLLRGTGLEAVYSNEAAVTIRPARQAVEPPPAGADSKEGKKSSSEGFRVAQAAPGALASTDSVGASTLQLAEVVVTAQKREQRPLDVPVPVTTIAAGTLADQNLLRLQDYYTQVPGFTVTPSVNGLTTLSIRGVTSGGLANPTVATTIDDVPLGTSNITAGGLLVPDLDPSDLARIEVLRGPQGTLYGASSLGGLFKYVTVDPSTQTLSGRVQTGVSTTYSADQAGYNVRGSINVPLNDSLAVRVSAFHRVDPGYVDNARTGQADLNRATADGGHLAMFFKPSDEFSIKLGALIQRLKDDGSSDVDVPTPGYPQTAGLCCLQQTRLLGTGSLRDTVQLYSVNLKGKIGRVDLTSVTGYGLNSESNSLDYTYLVSSTMQRLFGVSGAPFLNHYYTRKFSEELRVSLPIGEHIEWLVGGFFTSERTHLVQNIAAADPATGNVVGSWSLTDVVLRYKESAAFTDLTLHVTDRFDLQLGGRESHIDVPFGAATQLGARFGGQVIVPANESTANAFTYLVTPQFKFSPDLMAYARFASGYRPGAPNTGVGVALGTVPSSYAPDKTRNYELGLKGDFLDRRLSIDASVYYIDWKDIQLTLLSSSKPPQSYTGNAGAAKSQGVELSVLVRPLETLTISAWVSYDDAALTEAFPKTSTVAGAPGAALPTTARWSGSLSIDDRFPLTSSFTGFVGGSFSYIGDRLGPFLAAGSPRAYFPSYAALNLNTGVKYDNWTATVFANNLTDRRGVLNGGAGYFPPFGYSYVLPRTIGLNLARSF